MKLTTLMSETPIKRTKLLITEQQLKNLTDSIIRQQDKGAINKRYMIKQNYDAKKK